ncbi:hypothetical protein ABIE65_004196 [Constrictibacter sp. MBR-5]|uniref:hypothetical protein n=1 Tax=Constrictibacter sp. MBR-5 TaxID=3156467 RepID=UPI00339A09F9
MSARKNDSDKASGGPRRDAEKAAGEPQRSREEGAATTTGPAQPIDVDRVDPARAGSDRPKGA